MLCAGLRLPGQFGLLDGHDAFARWLDRRRASSLGLPVSKTHAAFVATGAADRNFQRGDAELKLGRALWVVSSWFLSAAIAAAATAAVAWTISHIQVYGIVFWLVANLIVRNLLKGRADAQLERVKEEVYERIHPEQFALESEDE